MNNTLRFFATPGPLTTAGQYADLLHDLPAGVASLVRVVQGLLIHVFWADQYGVQLDAARREEVQLRDAASMFARILELEPRPLSEARQPETGQVERRRPVIRRPEPQILTPEPAIAVPNRAEFTPALQNLDVPAFLRKRMNYS